MSVGTGKGGGVDAVAEERRAWNTRVVSLSFAVLGILSAGILALLPNRAEILDIIVATALTGMGNGVAYLVARSGRITAAALLLSFVSFAQHVLCATNPLAVVAVPYFASVFVMLAATCLLRKWMWPVYVAAAACLIIEWKVGAASGLSAEELRGPFIAAYVLLSSTAVVTWLHLTGLERAVAHGLAVEQERSVLQSRFEKSERMEALGRLAGGVAHDFNNLLLVMQGCADLAARRLDPTHPAQAELAQVVKAGARASELTSQLLTFSRSQAVSVTTLQPSRVIEELQPIMRRLVGAPNTLEVELSAPHVEVLASAVQLEQVLLNLVANARDASPTGAAVVVSLQERPGRQDTPIPALSEQHVEIAVTDNGAGIPEEIRDRIFEPFFTTKGATGGTGLGLATSFSLIQGMGGTILVESTIGKGSTFRVLLPPASRIL